MSSNMAASTKPIKVLTSYKQHELKLVKVAIRRHNIKVTSNNVQPLERDLVNPSSITSFVHMTGTEYGKLFRKITPNTIQLPQEAYCKNKAALGEQRVAPPPEPEPGPCRQRSASCSSDEESKQGRRSRSSEKHKTNDVAVATAAATTKQKRRSPDVDAGVKRKSTRSSSRSPPPKHSHRRHSPSNSPRSPRRSKSPSSGGKERVRNLSTKKGIFVPDKTGRASRVRDRHSCSKSPSPSSYRHSGRTRRRSRDHSRDRHRDSSRSTSSERHHRTDSKDRDRERHRSRRSKDRHSEDRRPEFLDQSEFYQRGQHFNPNLVHAPPPMIYQPLQPIFHPQPFPQFFNRQFYPPPDQAFGQYRPRKRLPVYNNRKIPNFSTSATTSPNALAPTSTVTSNGGAPSGNGDVLSPHIGANGIA